MKALYSEIKEFLPQYKGTPKAVCDALSLTGILVDSFTEVKIGGKRDYVIGLEVRQNRPDCLGVVGVAREVAAYLGTPFVLPAHKAPAGVLKKMSVKVSAAGDVARVVTAEIAGLDNSKKTPEWLAQALQAHGMNTVSFLVDISNYVMLMTGFPNHIFDAGKIVGGLEWQRMPKTDTFTTLDGTTLELTKGKQLVISDNLGPLVLASAIGGRRSAISERTSAIIAEVAVYDPAKMRADARTLKVFTEASNRLEKDLSAEMARWALEYLIKSLIEIGGGRQASAVFDYYPKQAKTAVVKVATTAEFISRVGGVTITAQEAERLLKRLGFLVVRKAERLEVQVPSWRTDVISESDIAEEVLRLRGFNTIPSVAPVFVPVPDVTPARVVLMDQVRTVLPEYGFDEALTLPMTTTAQNLLTAWQAGTEIKTQNAINEELPVLRQGLAFGLMAQQHAYLRKDVEHIALFEIGKVFGKVGKRHIEPDRLGLLRHAPTGESSLQLLQHGVERLLRSLGASKIAYEAALETPPLANPFSCFAITVAGKPVGILYKMQNQSLTGNKVVSNTSYAEIDIATLLEQLQSSKVRGAVELTGKLVVLDANVVVAQRADITETIESVYKHAGRPAIWSCEVVDEYALPDARIRYTVRVSYFGLSDAQAKSLHDKIFTTNSIPA